jgi:hypothetical protein
MQRQTHGGARRAAEAFMILSAILAAALFLAASGVDALARGGGGGFGGGGGGFRSGGGFGGGFERGGGGFDRGYQTMNASPARGSFGESGSFNRRDDFGSNNISRNVNDPQEERNYMGTRTNTAVNSGNTYRGPDTVNNVNVNRPYGPDGPYGPHPYGPYGPYPAPVPVPVPVPVPAWGGYGYNAGVASGVAAGIAAGAALTILPATAIAIANTPRGNIYSVDSTCYQEVISNGQTIYQPIGCP